MCQRATCELKANGCGEYTLQSSSNGWNTVDFVVTEKVLLNLIISDMLLYLSRVLCRNSVLAVLFNFCQRPARIGRTVYVCHAVRKRSMNLMTGCRDVKGDND